jgi:prepilin peptidase CpaA
MPSFFPDPVFGWAFYAVLVTFLAAASFFDRWSRDSGRPTIPRRLTVAMLACGLVFNAARGAWLGAVLSGEDGVKVWVLPAGPVWGVFDGLLFAVAGFALAFAVFFVLWIMGLAAGGDVKLFAAVGAWVGPWWFPVVLLGTGVVLVLFLPVMLVRKVMRKGFRRTFFQFGNRPAAKGGKRLPAGAQPRDRVLTYSLPVALSTALILPLIPTLRHDLGLQWQAVKTAQP